MYSIRVAGPQPMTITVYNVAALPDTLFLVDVVVVVVVDVQYDTSPHDKSTMRIMDHEYVYYLM